MAKRSRTRRILKWGGFIACVLIVVAWGGTLYWVVGYFWDGGGAAVGESGVCFYRICGRSGGYWRVTSTLLPFRRILPQVRSSRGRTPATSGITVTRVCVPLWLPFLIAATPTAFLFWRDYRRYPPGHCQSCGYNLTGNESGRCPECGKPIPSGDTEQATSETT